MVFQPRLRQTVPVSDGASTFQNQPAGLNRAQILAALAALNQALAAEGVVGELCLFDGAVMVLAFNARLATKAVDAVFQPAAVVRRLAAEVGESVGLPTGWLNDGVKGFLSARHELVAGSLPQFAHLRLTMPVPEYLLALKCMAARVGISPGEGDDTADIVFLARHLGLSTSAQILAIVVDYYPPNRLAPKTQFLVESLFEEGSV